jgi:hypothetical protein
MKIVVGTVRLSWAGPLAAPDAKVREPEKHQGCPRPAADQHQRCAVEPVVIIVEARSGGVRGKTDPLEVVIVIEPQGPDTFHDRGIAGTVRELIGERLRAEVQRMDEAILKFSGDRAAGDQARGNEYGLGIGTLSRQRQDVVRILKMVEGSAILQRGRACDQRIELAGNDRRKMRFSDKQKDAYDDNAPRSA